MGNKNVIFFTLWIILGNFCTTFSFDLETATGAEFGEFADEGTHAPFTNPINVDMQKKKKKVRENLSDCVYVVTVWACRSASH